jgi:hypothetical protein
VIGAFWPHRSGCGIRVLAVGAIWGLCATARAQTAFEVPLACGTQQQFVAEVGRLLGEGAVSTPPLEVTIVRPNSSDNYRLRLVSANETRELYDPDCSVLFRSAIVIAAAGARAQVVPTQPPSETADAASTLAPVPSTAQAAITEPVPARPMLPARPLKRAAVSSPAVNRVTGAAPTGGGAEPLVMGLGLAVGAGSGTVPGLSPSLEVDARLLAGTLGGQLALGYWFGGRAERDGRAVQVSALSARAAGIWAATPYLNVALGLAVNRLDGSGRSVSARASGVVWDLAPGLEVSVSPVQIGSFRLELAGRGQLSLVRPRFVVEGFGDIYRVPGWGAEATIRIVFQTR